LEKKTGKMQEIRDLLSLGTYKNFEFEVPIKMAENVIILKIRMNFEKFKELNLLSYRLSFL